MKDEVRKPLRKSRVKEVYDIIADYSNYSTLAGLIYVFMPGQPYVAKVNTLKLKYLLQIFGEKALIGSN